MKYFLFTFDKKKARMNEWGTFFFFLLSLGLIKKESENEGLSFYFYFFTLPSIKKKKRREWMDGKL